MYQVIARKYRPQTFEDVVGQDHVKQTLRNAIEQGRIAHGYIFSGPRGTGKTTTARILAMALNCEDGPSATPDPNSTVCSEIAAGSSLDVIEIDAASNRRIDDIRELRESVRFRPARDRYKVFIVDEAHQITSDAFNALLKTLEEPPEWVVFVLCTTEPHAIPPTITSRCQSFAFRAVDLPDVVEHLRSICAREEIEAEDDALLALALAGDGSVRDSLSTLDQAIAAFGSRLEAQAVRDLLGAIPAEVTERILEAIRDASPPSMLAVVDDVMAQGRQPQHFCGELARQFRNLMVMKAAGSESKLVVAGERERQSAETWLETFSIEDLTRFVQLLLALYQDLQNASQPRFRLEVGLLKLVYAGRLQSIEAVLSGLAPGEAVPPPKDTAGPGDRPPVAARPVSSPAPPTASQPKDSADAAGGSKGSAPDPQPAPADAGGGGQPPPQESGNDGFVQDLVEAIGDSDPGFLRDAIRASRIERDGRTVTFHVPEKWTTQIEFQLSLLEAALFPLLGGNADVRIVSDGAGQSDGSPAKPASAEGAGPDPAGPETGSVTERAKADPAFQEFEKRFEGRVRNVADLKGETQ